MKICVFCSSSDCIDECFLRAGRQFGAGLGRRDGHGSADADNARVGGNCGRYGRSRARLLARAALAYERRSETL